MQLPKGRDNKKELRDQGSGLSEREKEEMSLTKNKTFDRTKSLKDIRGQVSEFDQIGPYNFHRTFKNHIFAQIFSNLNKT